MKTMHLIFTDEEYDRIPAPKRPWVMDVVRKALSKDGEPRFYFMIDGKVMSETGAIPVIAARKLQLDHSAMLSWKSEQEAVEAGWVKEEEQV